MNNEEYGASRGCGGEELAAAFTEYRERLEQIVNVRMNPRLVGRVDAGDVLQEAFLEAGKRWTRYLDRRAVPTFVWLRGVVLDTLTHVQRRHFAQRRTVNQEVPLHRIAKRREDSLSFSVAISLVADATSPSDAAIRDEIAELVKDVLNGLNEIDREILVLRHFEQLTNDEVASVVGVKKAATSRRYMRALKRMRVALDALPGVSFDSSRPH